MPKDLESISHHLQTFRTTIEGCTDCYCPALLTLLEARIDVCQHTLNELSEILSHLTPDLVPTYEKLVSILRSLSAANSRTKVV
jgi:hypothetical protein